MQWKLLLLLLLLLLPKLPVRAETAAVAAAPPPLQLQWWWWKCAFSFCRSNYLEDMAACSHCGAFLKHLENGATLMQQMLQNITDDATRQTFQQRYEEWVKQTRM